MENAIKTTKLSIKQKRNKKNNNKNKNMNSRFIIFKIF